MSIVYQYLLYFDLFFKLLKLEPRPPKNIKGSDDWNIKHVFPMNYTIIYPNKPNIFVNDNTIPVFFFVFFCVKPDKVCFIQIDDYHEKLQLNSGWFWLNLKSL